jgi:hypothetical protein
MTSVDMEIGQSKMQILKWLLNKCTYFSDLNRKQYKSGTKRNWRIGYKDDVAGFK